MADNFVLKDNGLFFEQQREWTEINCVGDRTWIHSGPNASENTLAAYKTGQSKWERDPPQYACKAYTTARQELNILIHLRFGSL